MREIFDAIAQYAVAYKRLEDIQRSLPEVLPRGDQKTGVIAEFFGRMYAKARFLNCKLEYGSTSEHAWDIKITQEDNAILKIQIKAVSAHSEKGRISPIHAGWDELWLMRLNLELLPEAFWTYEASQSPWSSQTMRSRTMPRRGVTGTGSVELRGGKDEFPALWAAAVMANPSLNLRANGMPPGPRHSAGVHFL